MNDMLPIGSVIRARNIKDKLVIIGRIKAENDYDYICVKYPYGFVEIEDFFYVKRKDAISIVLLGDINY